MVCEINFEQQKYRKIEKFAIELVGAEFSHKDTICSMSDMFFNVHRENLLLEPRQCP